MKNGKKTETTLKDKRLNAVRLLGKYSPYIKKALRDKLQVHKDKTMMVSIAHSPKDKFGGIIPTHRLRHYAHTARIAEKIAEGIFGSEDKDLIRGIGIVALCHDIGQTPFGHNGETWLNEISQSFECGNILHGIEGAFKILYRERDTIIGAIKEGIKEEAIQEEAVRQITPKYKDLLNELRSNNNSKLESEIKQKIEEVRRNYYNNKSNILSNKIARKLKLQEETMNEAVWVIATGAGNHNGERGTANIKPKFERTNDEFLECAFQARVDKEAEKKMEPVSIVDAIVKIADQIASIPFDIIDAKRAGIESEISEEWAEPIANVLNLDEKERNRYRRYKTIIKR